LFNREVPNLPEQFQQLYLTIESKIEKTIRKENDRKNNSKSLLKLFLQTVGTFSLAYITNSQEHDLWLFNAFSLLLYFNFKINDYIIVQFQKY